MCLHDALASYCRHCSSCLLLLRMRWSLKVTSSFSGPQLKHCHEREGRHFHPSIHDAWRSLSPCHGCRRIDDATAAPTMAIADLFSSCGASLLLPCRASAHPIVSMKLLWMFSFCHRQWPAKRCFCHPNGDGQSRIGGRLCCYHRAGPSANPRLADGPADKRGAILRLENKKKSKSIHPNRFLLETADCTVIGGRTQWSFACRLSSVSKLFACGFQSTHNSNPYNQGSMLRFESIIRPRRTTFGIEWILQCRSMDFALPVSIALPVHAVDTRTINAMV